MIEKGTRRIAAKNGTHVRTTMRPTMLPRYIDAMRPQTKSGFSMKRSGPGCSPQIMRPPSSTAAVGEPGTPSVSIGSNAEVPAACAAVSGATTPSSMPVAASAKPSIIDEIVLKGDPLLMPTKAQNVSRYTEKNSGGPKRSANLATMGDRNVISSTATSAPTNDDVNAAVSAAPARPFWPRG